MQIKRLYAGTVYYLTIKPRLELLKLLFREAEIFPTGSRYVCNPPVLNTDIDFLVYSESDLSSKLTKLKFKETPWQKYSLCGDDVPDFSSWRKGPVNLIVTSNKDYVDSFNIATHIVKTHNVLDKYDRMTVYEVLRQNELEKLSRTLRPVVRELCLSLSGPYKNAMCMAYMLKNGIHKVGCDRH